MPTMPDRASSDGVVGCKVVVGSMVVHAVFHPVVGTPNPSVVGHPVVLWNAVVSSSVVWSGITVAPGS